ncbi:MAG: MarR family transcriptional regulator [Xanthomonadales bacterium]|nr:MarR family transcriptional regulator [Xanthomonadales bacterium]NIN58915.1 MarR family transcriptional regulator [Xanthomonadales bacterium]NIN74184.1 MarR family transcriptional regulator [Xanthomonadales bacterium]NIO13855.1 MarR family transcriptional regulator [Xanthomonadales bacterium]NIP11308.1 MarR family transcriptional regulator [Xanthomonadales bacterium]
MAYQDPFEIANECLAFAVRRASRLVTNHYDRHLAELGLRSTQFTILNALAALEEVTLSELAAQLETERTTLTRNLKPMEARHWLVKRRGRDRRSQLVSLSPEGRRILAAAVDGWQEAQARLIARLGRGTYRRLIEELGQLEHACTLETTSE